MISDRTVILGFAESLAAIETAWDLMNHGFVVHAFSRSGRAAALAKDPRIVTHKISAPEVKASETVVQLIDLATQLGWPVLMPVDDTAVWLLNTIAQSHPQAKVAGPIGELADAALNKRIQLGLASRAGLNVPPTIFREAVKAVSTVQRETPEFDPPWIIKPMHAIELVDGALIKRSTEFAHTTAALHDVLAKRDDGLIIQQYIPGDGEGLFGHAQRGAVSNWSAHRRIRMMNPSGSGSSACRSEDPRPDLMAGAERFIRIARWDGPFMLEFLTDRAGTPWFMELNGRTWGSLVLSTRRGLSYPYWAVLSALDSGQVAPEISPGPHLTARHIGRELLHLAFVARGRSRFKRLTRTRRTPDPPLAGYPKLGKEMKAVLRWDRSDVAYNSQKGRRSILVWDTWNTLLSALKPGR